MKKIGLSVLGAGLFILTTTALAANPSKNELKNFSTKLENHKTTLLNNIQNSTSKMKKIANESNKFADTSLFKAASCLGAIPPENQNLDFTKIISGLKENILNEYIKLDGEIKRIGFGITSADTIVFGNTIQNFYNENALKITNLENDYYLKSAKTKKEFLEYLENNKSLLTQLAQNMEYIKTIQMSASGAVDALKDFTTAINSRSNFLKTMEEFKAQSEQSFENELGAIITDAIAKYQPTNDLQAKYIIHKENFLKKYKADIAKAQYALFSAFFSYEDYAELLEKKQYVEKEFLNNSGSINCNLLLTTTFNIANYSKDVEAKSEKIKKGLKILTDATKSGKLNVKMIEGPTLQNFFDDVKSETNKLTKNFRLMLASEQPQQNTSNSNNEEIKNKTPENIANTQKITFTRPFNRGEYSEDIKVLQTLLKNRGYYQGAIDGRYSQATIEAVYHFQLKEGVITGKERNKAGYGRFGVSTRAKINSKI